MSEKIKEDDPILLAVIQGLCARNTIDTYLIADVAIQTAKQIKKKLKESK